MNRRKRILITEPIIESVTGELCDRFVVTPGKQGVCNRKVKLIRDLPRYDATLSQKSNPVDRDVTIVGSRIKPQPDVPLTK